MSKPKIEIDMNKTYQSNRTGTFKIIKDYGVIIPEGCTARRHILDIQFDKTGYIMTTELSKVLKGTIVDPYYPKLYGEGCPGVVNLPWYEYNPEYSRWHNMMGRCYDQNNSRYHEYGGAGVTVCQRWKCFEYYYKDLPFLPGYKDYKRDPSNYHLDKDILQSNIPLNQRVYSPTTCMFVHRFKNMEQKAVDRSNADPNKYIGVQYYPARGDYRAIINRYGMNFVIGRYKDPIYAANAYNHYARQYGLAINEDIPYIPLEETMTANLSPKIMCKIVNR